MDVTGTIKVIEETKQMSEKFRKREFVIITEDQYPQTILLQFIQDRCDMLNDRKIGEKVSVFFNVRGREWKNPQGELKYFNSLEAWKIDFLAAPVEPPKQEAKVDQGFQDDLSTKIVTKSSIPEAQADDLPF